MTLQQISDGIYLDDTIKLDFDAIALDCDGVLVDIRESYDATINQTVSFILKKYTETQIPSITPKVIAGFKATGGFNDEIDLAYAIILSLYKGNENFIWQVIKNSNRTGIISAESYILEKYPETEILKKEINYFNDKNNIIKSIFDELFYGKILYKKFFNKESRFTDEGLIKKDEIILNKDTVTFLQKIFNEKIVMVTGRGLNSVRYSLDEFMDKINLDASIFLEDESRNLAKPNPESLIRAITKMQSSHCVFVGDSMEELIMSKDATSRGFKTTFCGIIGNTHQEQREERLELFKKSGATIILDSINLLPKILNSAQPK
ncbi:MAG: HAD family hydrolase [Candidatus Nitrosoabyssus spongiisocia]|nr:MAG: HAD family hydrolase [Nitrosopumilaceae archaeon AB1(1)]